MGLISVKGLTLLSLEEEGVSPMVKLSLSCCIFGVNQPGFFGFVAAVCDIMSSNLPPESQSSENKCSLSTSTLTEVSTTPEGKNLKETSLKR